MFNHNHHFVRAFCARICNSIVSRETLRTYDMDLRLAHNIWMIDRLTFLGEAWSKCRWMSWKRRYQTDTIIFCRWKHAKMNAYFATYYYSYTEVKEIANLWSPTVTFAGSIPMQDQKGVGLNKIHFMYIRSNTLTTEQRAVQQARLIVNSTALL